MPDYIYALRCPVSGEIRYIGKSNDPETRLYLHVFAARRRYGEHLTAQWIRALLEKNLTPVLDVLLRVPDDEDWADHERRIIREHIAQGCKLTNQTVGGGGIELFLEGDEQRRRDSMRASWTDERRAKASAAGKAAWADTEKRERRIEKLKAVASTPKRRAELSAASRSRSAAVIKRLQDGSRAYWSKPEHRKSKNEQTRAKMIAGQAKMMSDKQWADPERRKAQSERMKVMRARMIQRNTERDSNNN